MADGGGRTGDAPDELHQAAESEGIRRMFLALQGVLPFMPLLPLVVVVGFWGRIEPLILGAWLAAAVSVSALRCYTVRAYFAAAAPDGRAAANRIAATSLWDGLVWGTAGLVFFVPESVPHQVLIVTMIVGIPAGSVFVTSYWPRVQYGFAIPAVGLTAFKLISVGSTAWVGLGLGMLAYLLILSRIMQRARDAAHEAIMLRFENLELVEQLREQKATAEAASVAKSQFLAAASHDLRQPLHALALFTDALAERPDVAAQREIIANIRRCVSALEDLFRSLLDISRLDAGIVEPNEQHFALRSLVERLAADFAPQAAARGVILTADCPDLVVFSDPALVERILLNLLSNAVRYTEKGSIRIHGEAAGDEVHVVVADTGMGIPADRHDDVFREFVQLENPERDRSKGLGLGLAIVHRLTTLLGGRMELDSAPGRGSEFRLALRKGDAAEIPAVEQAAPLRIRNVLNGRTIVVVEDEADVRAGMCVLLEGWGCRVVAGASGREVREALEAAGRTPDLIVADYRLANGVTGDHVIAELQSALGTEAPGVIITGDTAPARLQEALASGYLLLHKPLQPGSLRASLTSLLS